MPAASQHTARLLCMAVAALAVALPAATRADADGPDFFRVTGVAADDVLNMRDGAGTQYPRVGTIPPDADGLRNLGCTGGLSFAEWQAASEAERAAAARTRWCRVAYQGAEGWVAARFLAEGGPPAQPGGSRWRIAAIDGAPAAPGAELTFGADGHVSGTVGCNRFMGSASVEDGVLRASGPLAATMMACADPAVAAQEARVLDLLQAGADLAYDPAADAMTIGGSEGVPALSLVRLPE